jgi:protein O-GlcNAc transferase
MMSAAEDSYHRGTSLHEAGDYAGALAAFDVSLRMEEAVEAYARCVQVEPGHVAALYNQATALAQLQRWQDALAALDGIVTKFPAMADAWSNRAGVLQALGRTEEALDSAMRVLQLRPSDPRALYNAGTILLLLKRFDEAEQVLARASEVDPYHGDILGCLAAAALCACNWGTVEGLLPRLFSAIQNGTAAVPPLTLLALSDDPLLQRRCAELATRRSLANTELGDAVVAPMAMRAYQHDKVRIGYLSSDFRDHPVAAQVVGLLERHDRARFEVVGLSTGRGDGSTKHQRIVQACDRFFDIGHIGSREAAALILEAEIDILVDLNGQTMGWRPAILKYRPAPIIATYLGYAGTTGADFVDYIIGDAHVTPFELGPAMTEKIVQLPDSFWPNDTRLPEPEEVSRAEVGLPADAFVFCSFNSNHKIRPRMFDVWARLLRFVPGSVLWLRKGTPAMNERFRGEAAARGIDAQRIHFAGRMESFARHLGRQAQADLFLDTHPYNAHATASDALWAGLPVITLRGQSFVSRVSAGLLANAGLEELVASTAGEYENIALSLARDRGRLSDIRRRLANARRTLFDMDRFVGGIEAAYLEMQARAQRGEKPVAFRVGGA